MSKQVVEVTQVKKFDTTEKYGYEISIKADGKPEKIVTYRVYWETLLEKYPVNQHLNQRRLTKSAVDKNMKNLLKKYKCKTADQLVDKRISVEHAVFTDREVYYLEKNPTF